MSTNPISEELLACPLCGSAFKMDQEPHDNYPVGGMFYLYHEYGPLGSAARACPLAVNRHFETAEDAATAWNRRAADSRANQAVVTEEMVELAWLDAQTWPTPISRSMVRRALTAALSRAEGQEPVAYLHKPTGNVFKAAEFRPLLTVWQRQFADTHAPEEIEADFLPLYRSALVKAPAPVVPDGWKLVPVEPTEAMKAAAFGPIIEGGRGGPITKDFLRQEIGIRTFKAMIAAAPSFGADYPGGALSTEQSTLHPPADRGKSATPSQPLVSGEGE